MSKLIVYCDGGCRGNQNSENIGGWGVLYDVNWGEYIAKYKGNAINTTNNIMELTACIKAMENLRDKNIRTEIIMDSQYVIDGVNKWLAGWIKRGWRGSNKKIIKNVELWKRLKELKDEFRCIEFIKCEGHSANPDNIYKSGNDMADALVNEAMDELE